MYNFIKSHNTEIKSYLLGFFLSLILTIIPFFLAIQKIFSNHINYTIILICAISQIIVHFIYFLHLDFSLKTRFNLIALLFVIIIIFIVTFGSIWIMYNLNHHVTHTA
ncbi:cytochrome o ubiquinol oxidase subunit IV [Buchnera aphidicola]|uniref:Cytochrome bo(3) ubiquinol oxidase subunit 4 n=1 Tax=Buchnera aphidicola (Artemisaphis artemisicola) TaxID=1241836 RepID=A0A4D6XIS1_9GAMM|nr:cytochrome o ubiquinol oxidase subunit IV [Buchnera aphidicola]QCI16123.1 cytochrome o ubiquinol oxidase subunit IV [Buchnera aphidicola (Artemisaphis artemisicola)]